MQLHRALSQMSSASRPARYRPDERLWSALNPPRRRARPLAPVLRLVRPKAGGPELGELRAQPRLRTPA